MDGKNSQQTGESAISRISDVIGSNNVDQLTNKQDIMEIVSHYLENHQSEEPICLVNLADIVRQYDCWVQHLPRVKPFYGMKCNPDTLVLKVLHRLGCGIDCASKNEIMKALEIGVHPEHIVFSNPCKINSMIKFAHENAVDLITFDSEDELTKIKVSHPSAKLILRLLPEDQCSDEDFGTKFGCRLTDCDSILEFAKDNSLNVVGVSFNIALPSLTPNSFFKAIGEARAVFEKAKTLGFDMNLLDIGGGFPGRDSEAVSFESLSHQINKGLEEHFNDWQDLQVIAEPGRFFVSKAFTVVSMVINKKYSKDPVTGERVIVYYLSDGVYNSFYNLVTDKFVCTPANTIPFTKHSDTTFKCKMFGPTADSLDCMSDEIQLPDMEIGEHMVNLDMGAYSMAISPGQEVFNGFSKTKLQYYVN
jgi:ornithine decarboxylase